MALSLGRPTANTPAQAAELTQIIDLLEGAAGETLAFLLIAETGEDFIIRLSDAAGARSLIVQDSAAATVASINSNGDLSIGGSFDLSTGTLVLPQASSPSQTAEGSISWDTDDDVPTVGTGAATKRISLVVGAGATAAVAGELVYDTTAGALKLHDGSSEVTFPSSLVQLVRLLVEDDAYKAVAFAGAASGDTTYADASRVGTGFTAFISGSSTLTGVGKRGFFEAKSNAATGDAGLMGPNFAAADDPEFTCRFLPSAAGANITLMAGPLVDTASFSDTNDIITFRTLASGTIIGVCDSGGTETTRDTSQTPDGSTEHRLRVLVHTGGTVVEFYRNGTQVGADVTTNITADTAEVAGVGMRSAGATAHDSLFSDVSARREV
jgi:hypothetical protein